MKKKFGKCAYNIGIFVLLFITVNGYSAPALSGDINEQKNRFIHSHGNLIVKDIQIKGLEKTKPSVILSKCRVKPGEHLSEFKAEHLVQKLRKTNIFRDVDVYYVPEGDDVIINIDVKEKWSLIPMPVIKTSGDTRSFGAFVLDSNFLGYNKKLYTGGTWSNMGFNAQIGYIDPGILQSNFTMAVVFSGGQEIYENGSGDKDIYQEYQAQKWLCFSSLGYKFTDSITVSLTGLFRDVSIVNDYDKSFNKPESGQSYSQGIKIFINNLYYSGFFNYGFTGSLEYSRGIPLSEDTLGYNYSKMGLNYSMKVFNTHLLKIMCSGGASNTPDIFEERIGGITGFKTLPAEKIAADYYYSSTVLYEIPLYRFSYLNLTVASFFEQGGFKDDDNEMEYFYGPGGGLRFYLKRIALPALGFDVAYNINTGEVLYSAAIGASF